jgi:polar amino acid transport system substrate-binding protein
MMKGSIMKRILIGLFALAVLAFGTALPTQATEAPVLSRIVDSGELRVGMSGNQPPFNMTTRSGEIIGYDVDMARLLAEAMGVELVIVQKPFGDLLPALEKGDLDAVISGVTMTPKRNLKAAFVGPYMVSGKSVLTKSATIAAIDEAEDLAQADITLVALKGSTSEQFVKRVAPGVDLKTTKDYDAAVAMVLADEADAMVADFPVCALTLLRNPDAGLAITTDPLTIEPMGIALPPGDSLLLNMVENYFGALEAVGLLDLLDLKWFEDGSWLAEMP